jgi:hypothetical protein
MQWVPPSEIRRTIPAVREYAHAGLSYRYTDSHHHLVHLQEMKQNKVVVVDWAHGVPPNRKNDGYYHHAAPVHLEHEGTSSHSVDLTTQAQQSQYRLRQNTQWAPTFKRMEHVYIKHRKKLEA